MIRHARSSIRPPRRCVLGPDDSGRLITLEEYERSEEMPGYVCELIDGVVHVSPAPTPPHQVWVRLIRQLFERYAGKHPSRVDFVTEDCEVVIPGRPAATRPRPDVAAFAGFDEKAPRSWADVCPLVVVEVVSARRARKDTVRNRHLYWLAGGVQEYWVVDTTDDPDAPDLVCHIRRAGAVVWEVVRTPYGRAYRSPTLPGLRVNLRRSTQ